MGDRFHPVSMNWKSPASISAYPRNDFGVDSTEEISQKTVDNINTKQSKGLIPSRMLMNGSTYRKLKGS